VPAPNTAREFLARVPPGDEPLLDALERHLRSTTGVVVPRDAWDWDKVPAHLRPTYRVVDESGTEQARGKDLDALRAPLQPAFEAALAEVASGSGLTATGQTTWTFGTVEESVVERRAGHEVRGFPALVDEGGTVGLGVFGSLDEAEARHRLGVRRLLLLGMRRVDPTVGLDNAAKLGLAGSPYPTVAELVEDMKAAVAGEVVDAHDPARNDQAFSGLGRELDAVVEDRLAVVLSDVQRVLEAWRQTEKRLAGRAELSTLAAMQDMRAQVARLVHRGFVSEAGPEQLRRYVVYLAAVDHRRERLDDQVARDAQLMAQVSDVQSSYLHQVAALPEGRPPGAALRRVRWMLEEYRLSLWAQHLGTASSVSDQRIRRALADAGHPRS
jgi:ATP-dependent helicase HrpA